MSYDKSVTIAWIARLLMTLVLSVVLTACEDYAVHRTPAKQPLASRSHLAMAAEQDFWETLHQGRYQHLPHTIQLLTAAYLQNPNDPVLAGHLGFAHIWRITEYQRSENQPTIVNEIILANKYFSDAWLLAPQDARLLGFLADSQLVEGKIFNDQRQQTRAYFLLKRAIHAWPQFNYFTAGYPMSLLPISDAHFQEGLVWQWALLDACAHQTVDRKNPTFAPYMKRETQQGTDRACWNSWIAPHNFEGFFLNMGDMLVKNGDWQTGIKIYENAKLARAYATWPYRSLLIHRIQHAKENVQYFRQPPTSADKTILFQSGLGCRVCHQQRTDY